MEVTKWLKPSISVSRIGDSASVQAIPFLRPDPRVWEAGARRGCQGRAVALHWPHAPSFPGRALTAPSTAARSFWSG